MNQYLTNLSLEEICHYGMLGDIPVLSIEDWKVIQEKIHSFGDEQFESGHESYRKSMDVGMQLVMARMNDVEEN